jgi:anti-repressor protein
MTELIKITEQNGKQAVSARELYKFLEITERFSNWFDRQLQYGFTENVDYIGCKEFNTLANQELTDYALTLNCAKEISMIQRSEKGKQARLYFIECEKRVDKPIDFSNPDTVLMLAQNWKEERQKRLDAESAVSEQQKVIAAQAPKALFADAVATGERSVLVSELAKVLKQNGMDIGQNRLFTWLREKGYLCSKGEYYNQPSQKAMSLGLFELKKTKITKPDGSTLVTVTTKVTGKGQIYFVNKFLSKAA